MERISEAARRARPRSTAAICGRRSSDYRGTEPRPGRISRVVRQPAEREDRFGAFHLRGLRLFSIPSPGGTAEGAGALSDLYQPPGPDGRPVPEWANGRL